MTQVYAAKYSNVPVWVSTVNNVSVMRRQGDGWVNATHLLKVADFDKPRRTRILERDVQTGEHEKVQGGYGKYQGTWIPAERALELSEQVGISALVHELLVYTPQEGVEIAELPRVPKPMTARKQADSGSAGNQLKNSKKARKTNSVPASQPMHTHPIAAPRAQPMQSMPVIPQYQRMSQNSHWPQQFSPQGQGNFQMNQSFTNIPLHQSQIGQQMSMNQMNQMGVSGFPSYYSEQLYSTPQQHQEVAHINQPITQLHAVARSPSVSSSVLSSNGDEFSDGDDSRPYLGGNSLDRQRFSDSAAEPAVAALRHGIEQQSLSTAQGPSHYMADYTSKLLDFFMTPDKTVIPAALLHPQSGAHLNQPIDDEGNTAFHWTCAIGRIEIMRALLAAGTNPKALNSLGQTPLVRAVTFTNNYESRTFSKVLELLIDTVGVIDTHGQTILHHIAQSSSLKTRSASARYYMEILMAKLNTSSQAVLDQFPQGLTSWIDKQDHRGETALHLACKSDSRRLAKILLSYQASPLIPNKAGKTADDLFKRHKHHRKRNDQDWKYANFQNLKVDNISSVSTPAGFISLEAGKSISKYLTEMGQTYDTDLSNKDSDISQVTDLLTKVRNQIVEVELSIPSILKELGSEEEAQKEIERLEADALDKARILRQLIERFQARDLALVVQKEESDAQEELKQQLNEGFQSDSQQQHQLMSDLVGLQTRRRELVDEIVELYSHAGSSTKIAKYRRLLAVCCEIEEDQVDGFLDGISQALGTGTATAAAAAAAITATST